MDWASTWGTTHFIPKSLAGHSMQNFREGSKEVEGLRMLGHDGDSLLCAAPCNYHSQSPGHDGLELCPGNLFAPSNRSLEMNGSPLLC